MLLILILPWKSLGRMCFCLLLYKTTSLILRVMQKFTNLMCLIIIEMLEKPLKGINLHFTFNNFNWQIMNQILWLPKRDWNFKTYSAVSLVNFDHYLIFTGHLQNEWISETDWELIHFLCFLREKKEILNWYMNKNLSFYTNKCSKYMESMYLSKRELIID